MFFSAHLTKLSTHKSFSSLWIVENVWVNKTKPTYKCASSHIHVCTYIACKNVMLLMIILLYFCLIWCIPKILGTLHSSVKHMRTHYTFQVSSSSSSLTINTQFLSYLFVGLLHPRYKQKFVLIRKKKFCEKSTCFCVAH